MAASVLRPLFFDHLARFTRRHPGILNVPHIESLLARTGSAQQSCAFLLWKLLNFLIWANNTNIEFNVPTTKPANA